LPLERKAKEVTFLEQLDDAQKTSLKNVFNSIPSGRLKPYFDECGRNPYLTLMLYDWNSKASAAMYETLGHFEIMLRNRLDAVLVSRHTYLTRSGDWLDDAHGEFTAKATEAIEAARDRAGENARNRGGLPAMARGHVLAELTLSFWRRLLDERYESVHGSAVMRAFPSLKRLGAPASNMGNLRQLVEPLYVLRNRISHHEPIWKIDLTAREADAIDLISISSPDFGAWVRSRSRLPGVISQRPTAKN
jgi:hypothetical protein